MIDLRALVSSPHWRWLPGMLAFVPTLEPGETDPLRWSACKVGRTNGRDPRIAWGAECYPNLDDEVTVTLLLILVRRAWNQPEAHLVRLPTHDRGGAAVLWWALASADGQPIVLTNDLGHRRYVAGPTEAAALAAALLAAP